MKRAIGLLLLFLWVTPLWASSLASIIDRSSYSEEDKLYLQEKVALYLEEVEREGLPVSPLLSKLKEGIGKRVDPSKLVQALEKRKNALMEAEQILGEVGIQDGNREKLLLNLALSLEFSLSPQVLKEVVQGVAGESNPKNLVRVIESFSTFMEVGVSPEDIGNIASQTVKKNLRAKELGKMASLLEKSRRSGVEVERTLEVLERALEKYDNFSLVEMEVQRFIAASRTKPSLSAGQGVTPTSAGVTSDGTPIEEGGTPLESSAGTGHPPSQEAPSGPLE